MIARVKVLAEDQVAATAYLEAAEADAFDACKRIASVLHRPVHPRALIDPIGAAIDDARNLATIVALQDGRSHPARDADASPTRLPPPAASASPSTEAVHPGGASFDDGGCWHGDERDCFPCYPVAVPWWGYAIVGATIVALTVAVLVLS
jgi:hypothetical protein